MAIHSIFLYHIFLIVLLQSPWKISSSELDQADFLLRPAAPKYPTCLADGGLPSISIDTNVRRVMFTYFPISDVYPSNLSNNIPFYNDGCIWCQEEEETCHDNRNSLWEEHYCVMLTIYVGPADEKCLVFKVGVFQATRDIKVDVAETVSVFLNSISRPMLAKEHFSMAAYVPPKGLRQGRSIAACPIPAALDTAAFKCKIFPSSKKCVQRCAFGYTLESGIEIEMHCSVKDNVWKPHGFMECKPFVDCTVMLTSGGTLKCKTPNEKEAPECNIYCSQYEDKERVPEDTYTCDIDGKWDPPLPFCAVRRGGLQLAKAPAKKLHDD